MKKRWIGALLLLCILAGTLCFPGCFEDRSAYGVYLSALKALQQQSNSGYSAILGATVTGTLGTQKLHSDVFTEYECDGQNVGKETELWRLCGVTKTQDLTKNNKKTDDDDETEENEKPVIATGERMSIYTEEELRQMEEEDKQAEEEYDDEEVDYDEYDDYYDDDGR